MLEFYFFCDPVFVNVDILIYHELPCGVGNIPINIFIAGGVELLRNDENQQE